ncbi:D-alanyl-D-alanine carboxypeptidase [Rummeliibacillus sp. POC4]|uniref:D-alanyl-D-alanine carboxypeptidase n=1 Tax=Rummeliibacillus sp. POC4 TaxID=2305899 RepID=UPI000E665B68|nr:D-alanyl-D-alanine carboxypeptidase [Rummeliibacillus sp. POC4]RIJ63590.1 D-alanyl-D-alanine carboxypeptidase [Rummeliibacillus sp. POC4]
MKPITRTPLQEIRAQEELTKAKETQLQSLGFLLAQEKIKNIEKDAKLEQLGQELADLKIEVMALKGGVD